MSQITGVLDQLFKRHRIVLWYDQKREMRAEFESILLPGVEAIEINNNEFQLKYRMLRELPEQKFLLYHEGPRPEDLDNWLLDVKLAYAEFSADQAALWTSELGLPIGLLSVVESHAEFFSSVKRRQLLKTILNDEENARSLQVKMLAVCAETEPRTDEIIESLLDELAVNHLEKNRLIERCGLDTALFDLLKRSFGYESTTASIEDFAISLFKSCYSQAFGNIYPGGLNTDAVVFLRRWKDSATHRIAFENLSDKISAVINIPQDLLLRDIRSFQDLDFFKVIEQKILSELVKSIGEKTITADEVGEIIRKRRRSHWYQEFSHLYEAVGFASEFIDRLGTTNLVITSLSNGVQSYTQNWYLLDQLYRLVIFHARKAGHISVLEGLVENIENLYNNNFLLKVNDNWQQALDPIEFWSVLPVPIQSDFYKHWVEPFLQKNNKVYVIISDGLRYEVGDELTSAIRREDRYEAKLESMMSMLPSYTQLGMAALLPNQQLEIVDDNANVFADNKATSGTPNRDKILKMAHNGKAAAVQAEEILAMSRDTCRDLIRDNDLVYIYHNRIDSTGDKKDSEERVFEAVDETIQELIILIKKLTAANATNLIVTTDHGFIYQNRPLDESEFIDTELMGEKVSYTHRRFVLGKSLSVNSSLKLFRAHNVGLQGELDLQIPKSINRLRIKGAGARYVHGGAALQEVVLPVILINKKRESDTTKVKVDILRGGTSIITSGQLTVTFYQSDPVDEKNQGRKLRAGIYTLSGTLISDQHELDFDITAENSRQREVPIRFVLTREAEKANNQEVILRLEDPVPNTSHYQEYASARYTLRRSFTSDFDF